MESGKLYMVVGHYGSGKTEFVVNLAKSLHNEGHPVKIGDMDVINPFFCSREMADELKEIGIPVIYAVLGDGDMENQTSIGGDVFSFFRNTPDYRILDVGGDPAGARVLGGYAKTASLPKSYDLLMVINANRPYTQTVDQVLEYIELIEAFSRLKVTGLVNTTHMLRETTADDIIKGDNLVREVSERTGIPVCFTAYLSGLEEDLKDYSLAGARFPISMNARPEWM